MIVDEDFQPNSIDLDEFESESSLGEDRFDERAKDDWTRWPTDVETFGAGDDQGNSAGPPRGCMADAGDPPDSGTYVLGSVDGACQWIDTTTCP